MDRHGRTNRKPESYPGGADADEFEVVTGHVRIEKHTTVVPIWLAALIAHGVLAPLAYLIWRRFGHR